MAQITFKGNPVKTVGNLPEVGSNAPEFTVTKTDLQDVTLADFKGKNLILNIFPSVDTGVCAASVRKFNSEASDIDNTQVLCISKDLPFAHKRFCEAEGIKNVIASSEYKNTSFSDNYKIKMSDGPLAGLFSRSIVVIDPDGKVVYTEQVPEITSEPDYQKALDALK
ncbi:MAG: thiol peroxidase [Cyclobacteriaceae bacterium]|nr:thiol peroxidase [Cyclobacteriaceae bacterium]